MSAKQFVKKMMESVITIEVPVTVIKHEREWTAFTDKAEGIVGKSGVSGTEAIINLMKVLKFYQHKLWLELA